MQSVEVIKMSKAPGMDETCGEMSKFSGEVVVKWVMVLCRLAWEPSIVPGDWKMNIHVLLWGRVDWECKNHRGKCLLSVVGKVYDRIVIDRISEKIRSLVIDEQGEFMDRRGLLTKHSPEDW